MKRKNILILEEKKNIHLEMSDLGKKVQNNLGKIKKEDFIEYESNINRLIRGLNMIALCSFPLYDCSAVQLIDVVHRHEFALIKQDDKLELLENSVYKNAKYELSRSEEKFKSVFDNSPIGILLSLIHISEPTRPY